MRSKKRGNAMPARPKTIMMPAVAVKAAEMLSIEYMESVIDVVKPKVSVKSV